MEKYKKTFPRKTTVKAYGTVRQAQNALKLFELGMAALNPGRVTDVSFSAGTIYHIHEVVRNVEMAGSSVKLLGLLRDHDPISMRATLVMDNDAISIDTTFIQEDTILRENKLYHFIGELSVSPTNSIELQLRPRVVCDATGLDINLWKKGLEVRRKHLASISM